MTLRGQSKPNPGSDEAREQGCLCPVLDNNHGKSAPWPPDGWWIREDCPLHNLGLRQQPDAVANNATIGSSDHQDTGTGVRGADAARVDLVGATASLPNDPPDQAGGTGGGPTQVSHEQIGGER